MALTIDHKNILQQLENFKSIIQHLQQPQQSIIQHLQQPQQSIKEPVQQITVVQQQAKEPVQKSVHQIIVVQPEIVIKKQLKTKSYVLRAAKNYREKHPDKLKEYREKYPDKAVMYSADNYPTFSWAVFMAGGSFTDVKVDDTSFLKSAATMLPTTADKGTYVLANQNQSLSLNCHPTHVFQ